MNTKENNLQKILEVVMFENWLRFYFISQEDEGLFLRLSEKSMDQVAKDYPNLAKLAEKLNGQELNHALSVETVCLFLAEHIDNPQVDGGVSQKILDSPDFHFELGLFTMWVQNHEEQLDIAFMPFAQWKKEYGAWKKSPQVSEYITSIKEKTSRTTRQISTRPQ